ncbi:MAG: hemerythrin family protein [Minisyncoccia bacterium]
MVPAVFLNYTTDIPVVDQAHLRLIELVECIAVMSRAADHTGIVPALEELHAIQADHFSAEERIMAEKGFPTLRYGDHVMDHAKMMRHLDEVMRRSDNFTSRYSDTDFVRNLLVHIDQYDLRFVEWLHEQEKPK